MKASPVVRLRAAAGALAVALAGLSAGAARAEPACPGAAPALPHGDAATEYWDLTAQLEPGYRVFQRFLVTNLGPGDDTAAAVGVVVRPDGSVDGFDNGRRRGKWSLEDGLRLVVGRSTLDLHAPAVRIAIDKRSARISLELPCRGDPDAQPPARFAAAGHDVRVLAVSAPVSGTLWLRGMAEPVAVRGRASLSHTLAPDEGADVDRRLEFHSLGADWAWSLFSITPRTSASSQPPSPQGGRWLVIVRGERIVMATDRIEVTSEGLAGGWSRPEYPVPARVRVRATAPGAGERFEAGIDLGPVLEAQDPLATLPQPFRMWIRLHMDPLRVWAKAGFAGTLRRRSPGGVEPEPEAAGGRRRPLGSGVAGAETARAATPSAAAVELGGEGIAALAFIHPAGTLSRAEAPARTGTRRLHEPARRAGASRE